MVESPHIPPNHPAESDAAEAHWPQGAEGNAGGRPTPRTHPRTAWTRRLGRQIPAQFAAGGLTVAEIADVQRVTRATVIRHLPGTSRAERSRHDVGVLRRRGLVPLAIATALGLAPATTARYLRELEREGAIDPIPAYVGRKGPSKRETVWAKLS
jgi:hypothetical protein